MANRPWVSPEEVREYSEMEAVQQRSDTRLAVDIARAEQYVVTYTHNKFEDYEEIPPPVKTAVILLAEAYASQQPFRPQVHALPPRWMTMCPDSIPA